jgi:putative protease
LIIQDLAVMRLALQAGFSGEIHLSTLSSVSCSRALKAVHDKLRINCIVLPRELNIDEVKELAAECPDNMGLEIFVHGALCYGVSGRCYWSSYLGGKSGLRGLCVQPCRRLYSQNNQTGKFFSCMDLSLDVLVKVLLKIDKIRAWKIEGRKKGPHYVYYSTLAYRILRDQGNDPDAKKTAISLLEMALGRQTTHFNFLPQRPYNPINIQKETGSGLLIGNVKTNGKKQYLITQISLLTGDVIRIGYENEIWHKTVKINRQIPKKGRFDLSGDLINAALKNTPVFLTDRKEKELQKIISEYDIELKSMQDINVPDIRFPVKLPEKFKKNLHSFEINVLRKMPEKVAPNACGIWLSEENEINILKENNSNIWLWLSPVIWQDEEQNVLNIVQNAINKGYRNFVLNAPWQTGLFNDLNALNLWAGPFCNIANPLAIDVCRSLGFKGVIVSPELNKEEYLYLPKCSSLPLGIVISGNWPICLSRITPENLKLNTLFASPKNEDAWAVKHGSCIWIYPNWGIDILSEKEKLKKAGYKFFVNMIEPIPKEVYLKIRPGRWNWDMKNVGKTD